MNSNVNIIDHIQTEGFSNNTPMSKIVFNSLKMVNDFKNKGIVPRKSLILQPPLIDEQYFLPFILGYFDGDGSIYKLSQNNRYEISFVGTKEMLTWICEVLHLTNIPLLKRNYDNKNNYHIKIGGTNIAYSILKQLYESSPVFLDRKYEIYLNLKNSRS